MDLPTDVALHILNYASVFELSILSQINRRLHSLSSDDSIWRELSDLLHMEFKRLSDSKREKIGDHTTVHSWLARTDLSAEQIDIILEVYKSFLSGNPKEIEETFDIVEILVRRGKTWCCKDEFLEHIDSVMDELNSANKSKTEVVLYVTPAFYTGDDFSERLLEDRVLTIVHEYENLVGPILEVHENATSFLFSNHGQSDLDYGHYPYSFSSGSPLSPPYSSSYLSSSKKRGHGTSFKTGKRAKKDKKCMDINKTKNKGISPELAETKAQESGIRLRFATYLLTKKALRLDLKLFPLSNTYILRREWGFPYLSEPDSP